MARPRTVFACTDCGAQQPRWLGRCPECGAWNTLAEESAQRDSAPTRDLLSVDLAPGTASSSPYSFKSVGSTVFFGATNSATGRELWKSDGTTNGTDMVADVNWGNGSSHPAPLVGIGDQLLFRADDGLAGRLTASITRHGGSGDTISARTDRGSPGVQRDGRTKY